MEKVKRLAGVVWRFAGQSQNPSAEREPIVAVQNLHPLQDHIRPLLGSEGIALAVHELFEKTDRPGFDADEKALVTMIGTRGGRVSVDAAV